MKKNIYFISQEDMLTMRGIATRYDMSLYDFIHAVERQAVGNLSRWVRLTESEYECIIEKVKKNGTTITRWCCLAVRSFIQSNDADITIIFNAERDYEGKRNKRIRVMPRNKKEDADILRAALLYNISVSSLIRYCALRFDGTNVNITEKSNGVSEEKNI